MAGACLTFTKSSSIFMRARYGLTTTIVRRSSGSVLSTSSLLEDIDVPESAESALASPPCFGTNFLCCTLLRCDQALSWLFPSSS